MTRIFPNAATLKTATKSSSLSSLQQAIVCAITTLPATSYIQNAKITITNSVSYHTPS